MQIQNYKCLVINKENAQLCIVHDIFSHIQVMFKY